MHHSSYVYILANANRTVLYTGVTRDLKKILQAHQRQDLGHAMRLVYGEKHVDYRQAVARAEQLRAAAMPFKLALITAQNPEWRDLGQDIFL